MRWKPNYGGMTVNERLVESGLITEWDSATDSRDRQRMIDVLKKVDLGNQAEQIADRALARPKRNDP